MATVTVYTTPFCPFCLRAKALLRERGIEFAEVDLSADPALREEVSARSGRRTVPQVFIAGRSIGGFEELRALAARGELERLVRDADAHKPETA